MGTEYSDWSRGQSRDHEGFWITRNIAWDIRINTISLPSLGRMRTLSIRCNGQYRLRQLSSMVDYAP
jgi:hypothetical protein